MRRRKRFCNWVASGALDALGRGLGRPMGLGPEMTVTSKPPIGVNTIAKMKAPQNPTLRVRPSKPTMTTTTKGNNRMKIGGPSMKRFSVRLVWRLWLVRFSCPQQLASPFQTLACSGYASDADRNPTTFPPPRNASRRFCPSHASQHHQSAER